MGPILARIAGHEVGDGRKLLLIAGPCVMESEAHALAHARKVKALAEKHGLPAVFKASFDKANRSSGKSYRGVGLEEGLRAFEAVKRETGLACTTDVHEPWQAEPVGRVVDLLQVPAFLCRQTDLVIACARHGRSVSVKKGQFLAPHNMASAVGKLRSVGCHNVLLTERGSAFGYNRLVNDFISIPIMKDLGCPVVYDATHSVRLYGTPSKDPRGGEPQYIPALARAGVAAGCDALFMETHPDPPSALCDAASQFPLSRMEWMLSQARRLSEIAREAEGAS